MKELVSWGEWDGFESVFEDVEDPRTGNAKQHALLEILVIALATMLSGGETCADMALFGRSKESLLRQFLPLEHGIPSHDAFSRVFSACLDGGGDRSSKERSTIPIVDRTRSVCNTTTIIVFGRRTWTNSRSAIVSWT